jgi:hypothetical protein
VCVSAAHRAPGLPGDPHDDQRDPEADDWIRDLKTRGNGRGAGYYRQAHVGVGARVGTIGDQRRAVEPLAGPAANGRGDPVAGEAKPAGRRQRCERLDVLRVDEAVGSAPPSRSGIRSAAETTTSTRAVGVIRDEPVMSGRSGVVRSVIVGFLSGE